MWLFTVALAESWVVFHTFVGRQLTFLASLPIYEVNDLPPAGEARQAPPEEWVTLRQDCGDSPLCSFPFPLYLGL